MIHATDRELLIAATNAARRRMADHERDSWPADECDTGAEHIAPILTRWLVLYAEQRLETGRAAR